MIPLYLDFEFRNSKNAELDLVCCSYMIKGDVTEVWLEDKDEREKFAHEIYDLSLEHTFVAYAMESEARCLFQLWDEFDLNYKQFLKDKSIRFIDLWIEYKMLLNENNKIAYGAQLINGKIKTTTPPTFDEKKTDENYDKPKHNLGAAVFKMLGKVIDTAEKESVRGLIIAGRDLTHAKHRVQTYCTSDILDLPDLHKAIGSTLRKQIGFGVKDYTSIKRLQSEMYARGEYAARSALMTKLGIPFADKELRKFTVKVPEILKSSQEQILNKYPDIQPFIWNKRLKRYERKSAPIQKWIKEVGVKKYPQWPRTPSGKDFQAGMKQFQVFEGVSGFGGDWSDFLWEQSQLKSFVVKDPAVRRRWLDTLCDPDKPNIKEPIKTFWDSAGDDGRSRPYLGIYGSQSARTQPSSTGFLPLKSHWMRCFIVPPKGKAIVSIDYANQEFLLAALISGDPAMIKAYESGDPYVWFAKAAGAIPRDGTKESHPSVRKKFKSTTLGVQYGMGKNKLADKLTDDTGEAHTVFQSKELIDIFHNTFPDYANWKKQIDQEYKYRSKRIKLPCGWYMWGDNQRSTSVQNCPIQGYGSSIMRKSVEFAQDTDLDVIFTLHDALSVECPSQCLDYTVEVLKECMDRAFKYYFQDDIRHRANCRMDVYAWSLDYKNYKHSDYKTSHFYLEEKGEDGYNKYKEYLPF